MYPSNDELLEIRRKHFLPTGLTYHQEPIHLVKASGCSVWDQEGREYLDAVGGIVCISAGHNHPKIKKAIYELLQNDEIQNTSLLYKFGI